MKKIWTDRSRVETAQHCRRERWLTYHEQGTGIVPARTPLPLAVGGAVHRGLEVLLHDGQEMWTNEHDHPEYKGDWSMVEQAAVNAALAHLGEFRGVMEVDSGERAAMVPSIPGTSTYDDMLKAQASSLGMDLDGLNDALAKSSHDSAEKLREFDDWLWEEQSALVEGLVRAYSRRRLRPLLEEFIVLEVEREGEWKLADHWSGLDPDGPDEIWFMSRPDALLLSRIDNNLYILSYKTAASWDHRKAKDAQHDAQGLSEGVEIERRLRRWWEGEKVGALPIDPAMRDYLNSLEEPPRIHAIRYEYILKGERWKDKDLSSRFGFECRSQKSHLVRWYKNHKTGEVCWSWDFINDEGKKSTLSWASWKGEPVSYGIADWIDLLDSSTKVESEGPEMVMDSTISFGDVAHTAVASEPKTVGWRSAAQAKGYTPDHPLDSLFIPPITIYRTDDDLRDWLEQTESQEKMIAAAVDLVQSCEDETMRRSRLNQYFPMTRRACSYPSECAFVKVCYGGEDIRRDPLGTGSYRPRLPNHEAERKEVRLPGEVEGNIIEAERERGTVK